jgi:TolB protein
MMIRPFVALLALLAASCSDDPTGSSGERPGAILFLSTRDNTGGARDVYAMNPDGGSVRRLTTSPHDDGYPRWSPDGRRIAFVSQRDSVLTAGRWARAQAIYVMNADGSGARRLTDPEEGIAGSPAWSPDGRRIAFTRSGQWTNLWIMNADGSGKTRLTANGWDDFAPTFTRDGTRILYLSNEYGAAGPWARLFSMNVNGSGVTELPRPYGGGSNITWYDLSPDGSRIAFSLDYPVEQEIYTMTVAGTNMVRLTTSPGEDTHPVWSPDGARLLFTSMRDGNYEVYSITSGGTDLRRLTTDPATDLALAWRR